MSSKLFYSLAALTCIASATGCGLTKNLDDMHTSTEQMNKSTEEMNKKMDQMTEMNGKMEQINAMNDQMAKLRATMDPMAERMHSMSDQFTHLDGLASSGVINLMHGTAQAIRRDELTAMKNAKNLSEKFTHAAAFFAAYEYQFVLRGTQEPAQSDDETFRKDAVTDFFFQANSFTKNGRPIDLAIQSSQMMDLYALSAAADYLDSNTLAHLQVLKRDPKQFLTMYGMIEQALDRKREIQAGGAATAWENQVLIDEHQAVYLLQLRANILAGVAFNNISNLPINPHSFFDRIDEFAHAARYIVAGWTGSVADKNDAQLADYCLTMTKANEARDFLEDHGYDTRTDLAVHQALKNFRVKTGAPGFSARRNSVLKCLKDQVAHYAR